MTVQNGTPAYPPRDSSPVNTKWEALRSSQRMADSVINGPIAAVHFYSLQMVKTDSKQDRRAYHDKLVRELGELEGMFKEYCREPFRWRRLLPWLRSHPLYR